MPGSGDVEFLGDDGRVLGSDEELAVGPRRHAPRRARQLLVLLVMVAAGVGIAFLIVKQPAHRPARTATPALAQVPVPPGLDIGTRTIALASTAQIVDVQIASDRVYVLQTDRISVLDSGPLRMLASEPHGLTVRPGQDQLVLDAADQLGWIVSTTDASSGRIRTFDAKTLEIETTVTMQPLIEHAVAIGNTLYFTTNTGLYEVVGYGIQPVLVHAMRNASAVAADVTRRQLVLLTADPKPALTAVTTNGRVVATTPIDITNANVAVTGATIWLTGDTPQGAVVRTVDPRTLRLSADLDIATALGRSATIVAAGTGSVWLRDALDGSGRLWCRNAVPGPDGPSWTTNATVRSATGLALVTDGTALRTLPLVAGCAG